MEREVLEIKVNDLSSIVHDDHEDFNVIESNTTGHWRHGSEETTIVQRVSDGKYFKINWRDSVKDECMFTDMNSNGSYIEVFPHTIETTIYK